MFRDLQNHLQQPFGDDATLSRALGVCVRALSRWCDNAMMGFECRTGHGPHLSSRVWGARSDNRASRGEGERGARRKLDSTGAGTALAACFRRVSGRRAAMSELVRKRRST